MELNITFWSIIVKGKFDMKTALNDTYKHSYALGLLSVHAAGFCHAGGNFSISKSQFVATQDLPES